MMNRCRLLPGATHIPSLVPPLLTMSSPSPPREPPPSPSNNGNISPRSGSPYSVAKHFKAVWIAELHISSSLVQTVTESGGFLTLPWSSTVILDDILMPEEVAGCRGEAGINGPAYGLGSEQFTVNLSYREGLYRMFGPWEEMRTAGELVEDTYVGLWVFARPDENTSSFLFVNDGIDNSD